MRILVVTVTKSLRGRTDREKRDYKRDETTTEINQMRENKVYIIKRFFE